MAGGGRLLMAALLLSLTAIVAFVMAFALIDQWQERRGSYQLAWMIGSLLFGLAAAAEAIGAATGWTPTLFRVWYLAGAVLNVGSGPRSCSAARGSATRTPCSSPPAGSSPC
jgi:hypothetical protein